MEEQFDGVDYLNSGKWKNATCDKSECRPFPYKRLDLDFPNGASDDEIAARYKARKLWWLDVNTINANNPLYVNLHERVNPAITNLTQAKNTLLDAEKRRKCDEKLWAEIGPPKPPQPPPTPETGDRGETIKRVLFGVLVLMAMVVFVLVYINHRTTTSSSPPPPPPGPNPVPHPNPKPGDIIVQGNKAWTTTEVLLSVGDKVEISASGGVSMGPGWRPTPPEGKPDCKGRRFPANTLPCWSLIGRIGRNGKIFYVGDHIAFSASTSGQLLLGVNDDILGDNSGAWTATVALTPAPKSKVEDGKRLPVPKPVRYDLNGMWLATYPNGPLRVSIRQSEAEVVAILITGNVSVPAGEIAFKSRKEISKTFSAEQICALPNYDNPVLVKVKIKITDKDHFTETAVPGERCGGFTVNWSRISSQGCNGRPASGHLNLSISRIDFGTGLVRIDGIDDRRPKKRSFTWAWGDGNRTEGWFPQSHWYANTEKDYLLQVISHEDDGTTECAQTVVRWH
jgi:hypothetical protein